MIAAILKIASSISLLRIINVLGSFISMMMVGYLGKSALAAAIIAVLTVNTVYVINISFLQALTILIRQYRSQMKTVYELSYLIKQGYFIAISIAFISSLVLSQMDKLLLLIGQDPKIIVLTKEYFHYSAVAIYPALMINIFSQINQGFDRFRMVVIIELITMVLRVFWSYGFVLGQYGFTMLGLSGVAKADLFVNILMLTLIILYISKSSFYKPLNLLRGIPQFNKSCLKSLWSLGLPIAIQTGGELGAFLTSIFLMGHYGVIPLAALQISNQYLTLCMILGFGFTQALTVLIREAVFRSGAQHYMITRYIKTALGMALIGSIPIALLFFMHPSFLLSLFIDSKSSDVIFLHYCKLFFGFNAVLILLDSVRSVLTGVLRGLNDTKNAMLIGLFSLWCVSIPCSTLSIFLNYGPLGVRLGIVLGFLIWVILLSLRVYKISFANEQENGLIKMY